MAMTDDYKDPTFEESQNALYGANDARNEAWQIKNKGGGGVGMGAAIAQYHKDVYDSPEEKSKRLNAWMNKRSVTGAIDQANQFNQSTPGIQQDFYSQIEGDAKRSLADQQRDIRRQANRRGLLYSGLRQGDEARAASGIASQAAEKKSNVSKQLQDINTELQQKAAEMAQKNYAGDLQISTDVYNMALESAKQRAANLGAGVGAIGTVAGAYFGRKK